MAKKKYNPKTFPKLAEEYAKQGCNDKNNAKRLGVSESTFYEYVKKYPKFLEALKRGKAPIDEHVENAYYKLATGFFVPEEKIVYDSSGNVKEKIVTKKFVFSERAGFNWMCNRMKDKWQNAQHITSENKTDVNITQADFVMETMTFEERQKFLANQLKENNNNS